MLTDLQGGGHPVGDEVLDALEDGAGDDDAVHNGGEARLGQHDVGSRAGGIGSSLAEATGWQGREGLGQGAGWLHMSS